MANTRIRYKKDFNRLESNSILCGIEIYTVILDAPQLIAHIFNSSTQKVVYTFNANSLSGLKKKAKAELIKLGAKFNQEIRNRGNTEKLDLEKL